MSQQSAQSQQAFKDFDGSIHLVFSSHWDREWYLPFQKFRMALKPFDGAVPATGLHQIAQSLAAAPHAEFLDIQELADMGNKKELRAGERPAIAGNVVLSSSALEEGRWIFRVFNPTDKQETVQLVGAESWEITDLRGGNPKPVRGKSATIAPRQILTLRASARGIS